MYKFIIISFLSLNLLNANFIRSPYNENIVTDTSSGLIWEDKDTDTMEWKDAINYCKDLEYGIYKNWRMPNYNELKSLVDYNKSSDVTVDTFKFNLDSLFFTSTINANTNFEKKHVWTINFSSGHDNAFGYSTDGKIKLHVRCVHNLID